MAIVFSTTPSTPPAETLPSYLSVAAADLLAASLLPAAAADYLAATPTQRAQALAAATAAIDAAHRWQGRRCSADQVLEFPRVPWEGETWDPAPPSPSGAASPDPVVPQAVKLACLLQASHLLGSRSREAERIAAARAAGLTSQTTGSLSESYAAADAASLAALPLVPAAASLLLKYRLRSGRLL